MNNMDYSIQAAKNLGREELKKEILEMLTECISKEFTNLPPLREGEDNFHYDLVLGHIEALEDFRKLIKSK